MEQVLGLLVLALVVYLVYKLLSKPDQNDDGKVDAADVVEVAKQAVDVNQDGKVDLADASAAAAKVKKGRKKKAKV